MSSYLNKALKSKLPDSTEIELHLFEFCNLNCAFCGQDHDSTVGMNLEAAIDKAKVKKDKFILKQPDIYYNLFANFLYKPNTDFEYITKILVFFINSLLGK